MTERTCQEIVIRQDISLKELNVVQVNEELKPFAVNEKAGLVWICFFLPMISLIAVRILLGEPSFLIIVSSYPH